MESRQCGLQIHRYFRFSAKASLVFWGLVAISPYTRAEEGKTTASLMPAAQQNAVLQQYCGSCHSDALMYGGLSVEHFDAAHPEPSVAAMLVSKLTSGLTPRHVQAADHGPDAERKVMSLLHGAMGAAGTGLPDEATQIAFGRALSAEATGAEEWDVRSTDAPANHSQTLVANILRELPSTVFPGKTDMYRLTLTCQAATHKGEIRLTWANGVPEEGREATVEVDGASPFSHLLKGSKAQGNGVNGPGATILYPNPERTMPFPTKSLTIRNVFPQETVAFPFENLSPTVRRDFSACFH